MSGASACEDRAREIEGALHAAGARFVKRVVMLEETHSTQDAAKELSRGEPGLLVLARRQTRGRGRLGRAWADTRELGVAGTFVLAGSAFETRVLSLASGLAVLRTCRRMLEKSRAAAPRVEKAMLGLRWPNDVVESHAAGRKLAGVLIEASGGAAYVGIGINVLQSREDWEAVLRERAASLRELGAHVSLDETACELALRFDAALREDVRALVASWREANVLLGRRVAVRVGDAQHAGVVVDIDPMHELRLRCDDGTEVALPTMTTSLIHDPHDVPDAFS